VNPVIRAQGLFLVAQVFAATLPFFHALRAPVERCQQPCRTEQDLIVEMQQSCLLQVGPELDQSPISLFFSAAAWVRRATSRLTSLRTFPCSCRVSLRSVRLICLRSMTLNWRRTRRPATPVDHVLPAKPDF